MRRRSLRMAARASSNPPDMSNARLGLAWRQPSWAGATFGGGWGARCGARRLFHRGHASAGFQVLVVDLLAIRLGDVERIQDLQRHSRIHGAALGIEWAVGREHDLLERKERKSPLGTGRGA